MKPLRASWKMRRSRLVSPSGICIPRVLSQDSAAASSGVNEDAPTRCENPYQGAGFGLEMEVILGVP